MLLNVSQLENQGTGRHSKSLKYISLLKLGGSNILPSSAPTSYSQLFYSELSRLDTRRNTNKNELNGMTNEDDCKFFMVIISKF